MNIFKKIKQQFLKGSDYIKSKIPNIKNRASQADWGSGSKPNRGQEIFKKLEIARGKYKAEAIQKKYDNLRRLEETRKAIEEEEIRNIEEFRMKQKLRNDEINRIYFTLEEWERRIARDNGLLELDTIPPELLDQFERADKIEEYNRIIEDAETEIRKKLVKGYDDFLHMLSHTILPDLNEGFMDNLKEAFKNASLTTKSNFLEEFWKVLRENYEDIHSGSETLWGIEIQQGLAQGMLDFLEKEGIYKDTWSSDDASNE